jgi:hypothetical protein
MVVGFYFSADPLSPAAFSCAVLRSMGLLTEEPSQAATSLVATCLLKSGLEFSSKDFMAFHGWIFGVGVLGMLILDESL